MYLIESSNDVLYLVISFCVLWLTIFLAWLIYYLAMITRQVYQITKEMRERARKIDDIIKNFREKVEHSASYLVLISEGIKKLVEMVKDKGGGKKEKTKKISKK